MEINRLDDVIGAYAIQDLVEGTMVVISPVPGDTTVLGARNPIASDVADARYVVTWPQSNLPMPGPLSYPSLTFALRTGGFDQAQTQPISQTLYLTYPGMTDGKTIPSGSQVVLHGGDEGMYTISSGVFTAAATLVPGAKLAAAAGTGKLAFTSTESQTVATVVEYDSVYVRLTIKTRAA